jgi:glycosyltransferase involved in cell wall biosynthesis
MCAGLPSIISSRCGCAADLVTDQTGWLFNPDKTGALSDVMSRAAATPKRLLSQMGTRARQTAAKYSPPNAADLVICSISVASQAAAT